MFGKRCLNVGGALLEFGGLDLIGLGQDDLVAHGRFVERVEDVEIDLLEAMAGVDQHIDPRQTAAACRNLWISAVHDATLAFGAEA